MITQEEIEKEGSVFADGFRETRSIWDIRHGFIAGANWVIERMKPKSEEQPIPVIQFGKTNYDNRIFDNLYRVYGDTDAGTILSAHWKDELKVFKIDVPFYIINNLIEENNIVALCSNYDWKELNIDPENQKIVDQDRKISDLNMVDPYKSHILTQRGENYYKKSDTDPELEKMLETLRKQPIEPYTPPPSRLKCLELASKAKYSTVSELLQNADKIFNYSTQE